MAGRSCHNCVYSCHDPELWLRCLAAGEPLLPRCANHPRWPGRLHDVPGVPCRNYRARPATPAGEVRMIPLGDGCYAYVDATDYPWLSQWNWRLCNGYAARIVKGKLVLMHRLIARPPKGMIVDHADGNKANNCRANLRVCTPLENRRNKRKASGTSSRFKGVCYRKQSGRWYARCQHKGVNYAPGGHDSELAAARAYDRAAVACFKEYARPNLPEEWPPERRAEVYAQPLQPPPQRKKPKKSQAKKASRKKTEDRRQKAESRKQTRDCKGRAKARRSKESKSRRRGTTV
jgi:hypothetical protein